MDHYTVIENIRGATCISESESDAIISQRIPLNGKIGRWMYYKYHLKAAQNKTQAWREGSEQMYFIGDRKQNTTATVERE